MQTTTETNVNTKIDFNIDYAKIEVRAAREALAAAKNKAMLVALAVSIGVLKSKSSNAAKTIRVEPLRGAIEDALRTAEQRAAVPTVVQRPRPAPAAEPIAKASAPWDLTSRAQRRQQVRLTNEQRARKLARNRRRHKRALTRSRHGWANGQQTIRGAA